MTMKSKTGRDWEKVEWMSMSFKDSFGSADTADESSSPVGKKARLEQSCDIDVAKDCVAVKDASLLDRGNKLSDGRVWTDKYKPKCLKDLVVHKKKVGEVCDFLKNVFSNRNHSKIVLLAGPTGCGKTCTFNAACRDLKINVMEWVMPVDNQLSWDGQQEFMDTTFVTKKPIGLSKKAILRSFDEFILRATKYSSLLESNYVSKVVLVKDIPNVLVEHPEAFHEIIKKYYNLSYNTLPNENVSPLAFILSDTNILRDLFPEDVKVIVNLTNINFNPVTDNNVVKVLERMLLVECSGKRPTKEQVVNMAESSDGDLRSAILKLQFSICNESVDGFKMPKAVPNSKSERIRVIKTSSKSAKPRVCEIDKDKIVDFFNSVGRVLYPKKEAISDGLNSDKFRFVHSPNAISDVFLTEPNKFINILHENYLERFTSIKDAFVAANYLSTSDLLLSSFWQAKDTTVEYALNVTTRGLMVANQNPAPNTFRPISKSKMWVTENRRKDNIGSLRHIFPDIQSESDVLLDIVPYLNKLKGGLNLTPAQSDIIHKIAKY